MAEILNAGFTTQYLWELRNEICDALDAALDGHAAEALKLVQRTLSTFHFAIYQSPVWAPAAPHDPAQCHLIEVYSTLIQRGLPTLVPLPVERAIHDVVASQVPVEEQVTEDGAIRFATGPMNLLTRRRWLAALFDGHLIVDSRLHPSRRRADEFGSPAEFQAYTQLLPAALGAAMTFQLELQRPLESMLPPKVARNFQDQRVDFAMECGGARWVVEIDGKQHLAPLQSGLDKARDDALFQEKWRTTRVQVEDVGLLITRTKLQNLAPKNPIFERLNARLAVTQPDELEALATAAVQVPYAVARVQRILLWALAHGYLRLDQQVWRLVVVERDVAAAHLALADFIHHVGVLAALGEQSLDWLRVELVVYQMAEVANSPSAKMVISHPKRQSGVQLDVVTRRLDDPVPYTFNADLLIDLALMQPPGFDRLATNFIERHLTTTGLAVEARACLASYDVRSLAGVATRPYPAATYQANRLTSFLENIFRKKKWRPGQAEILARALALQPVIGLLPTGAGKSLCYQLAVLLQPGFSLVVVPINSLMFDQVDNLCERLAIDWIDFINGQRTADERDVIMENMAAGRLRLLFISPERLQNDRFRMRLAATAEVRPVAYAVIDEAHCVSEWGHDFRTSYLGLAKTIRTYGTGSLLGGNGAGPGGPIVGHVEPILIALTGTASVVVLSDVQREIGIDDESAKVYPPSFDRKELAFRLVKVPSKSKPDALAGVLAHSLLPLVRQAIKGDGAVDGERLGGCIVFVPHTNGVYGVVDVRHTVANTKYVPNTEIYCGAEPKGWTGPLSYNDYKLQVQRDFKANRFACLVATKAFGMGVDKPNVRITVHYNLPQSLEAFYQEAGRAGRDRKDAECWVILSDDFPEEADHALHVDTPLAVVAKIGAEGYHRGDVPRLIFLQQRGFPGILEEVKKLTTLVKDHLQPHLALMALGSRAEVAVPFGKNPFSDDGNDDGVEKAIYRLAILGLITDYTVDYGRSQFMVTVQKQPEDAYITYLAAYIDRYKTWGATNNLDAQVRSQPGMTLLGKSAYYLLCFVYSEIERKRRVAIRSMLEVARQAAELDEARADDFIRQELMAYLEESLFTKPLAELATRIMPDEWISILDLTDSTGQPLLQSVDGVRQLVGGCRRVLESYPEHPGLLFLDSLGRLLLPQPESDRAYGQVWQMFGALGTVGGVDREATSHKLIQAYRTWLPNKDKRRVLRTICERALDAQPTRSLARSLYDDAPAYSRRVILNLTVGEARALADRLCGLHKMSHDLDSEIRYAGSIS